MIKERYSIEVSDEVVLIYGDLTMRETFDFLAFFDQQGFKSCVTGEENSTICLMKHDCIEQIKKVRDDLEKQKDTMYEGFYKKERQNTLELSERILKLQDVIKSMKSDSYKAYEENFLEINKQMKDRTIEMMLNNPQVQGILKQGISNGVAETDEV